VKRLGYAVLMASAMLTGACARKAAQATETGAAQAVAEDVVLSLEVKVARDSVEMILHATNPASQPVTLQFPTGQRYDFTVLDGQGREVWRWSSDMMFTQAFGTEVLAPGKGLQYRAVWPSSGRSGSYVAVGRITSPERRLEQRTEFEIAR
jgi:hypothetical protein